MPVTQFKINGNEFDITYVKLDDEKRSLKENSDCHNLIYTGNIWVPLSRVDNAIFIHKNKSSSFP